MAVGSINAPGGKVVVVDTNYGRIIVGDSWPKLIVRAAVTGLVIGLVLLLGQIALALVAPGLGGLGVWLFKKGAPREVPAASGAGGAVARVLVALAVIAIATATPPVARTLLSSTVVDAPKPPKPPRVPDAAVRGVVDALDVVGSPIDAAVGGSDAPVVRDATAPATPSVYVLRDPDTLDGCPALIVDNGVPTPDDPRICKARGATALYAGLDFLTVIVVGATEEPTYDLSIDGEARFVNHAFGHRGNGLFLEIMQTPSQISDDVRVTVKIGSTIVRLPPMRTIAYPEPFWFSIDECLEQEGPQRELRRPAPCELELGGVVHMHVAVEHWSGAVVRQSIDRDAAGLVPRPFESGMTLSVPKAHDGALWAITVDLGDPVRTSQTVTIRLRTPAPDLRVPKP